MHRLPHLEGLAFVLVLGSAAHAQGPPVLPGALYPSVADGTAIEVGDLNGDSHLDVVTANGGAGTISALLGAGDGTLGAPASFPTGAARCEALVLADFNGDGAIDAATANSNPKSISILLGAGTGAFGSPSTQPLSDTGRSIAAGDLNGDGAVDLAVASFGPPVSTWTLTTFFGDGLGGFGTPASSSVNGWQPSVALGDLNGDGALDAVVTFASSSPTGLVVFLNAGGGSLAQSSSAPINAGVTDVVLCDLDGSGTLDLAACGMVTLAGGVVVTLGNGAGAFGAPKTFPFPYGTFTSYPRALLAADIDGNGQPDLAAANKGSGTLLLNSGTPDMFGAVKLLWPGREPLGIATGDFDEDGQLDVAFLLWLEGFVSVLLNEGGAKLGEASFHTGGRVGLIAAGDWNGDGVPDIAAVSADYWTEGTILVMLGVAGGGFATPVAVPGSPGSLASGIVAVDVNHDGKTDLVVGQGITNSNVLLFLGDGLGGFVAAGGTPFGPPMYALTAGDLNGDGFADLAGVDHSGSNKASVALATGPGAFGTPTSYAVGEHPYGCEIGDVNSDGVADVATANETSSAAVTMLLGNGSGALAPGGSLATPTTQMGLNGIQIFDVNGDGRNDVVTTTKTGVEVYLKGVSGFAPPVHIAIAPQGHLVSIEIGDLTGDGVLDVVATDLLGSAFWLFAGGGSLAPPRPYAAVENAFFMRLVDLDADGRLDVVTGGLQLGVSRGLLESPAGLSSYGSGTSGCLGRGGILASVAPHIGSASFRITATNVRANATGLLFVGNAQDVAGSDPLGVGVTLHVDPTASTRFLDFMIQSDPGGTASAPIPIPNLPPLVGTQFFAQVIFDWTSSGICSPSAGGLSSSKGLAITFLP